MYMELRIQRVPREKRSRSKTEFDQCPLLKADWNEKLKRKRQRSKQADFRDPFQLQCFNSLRKGKKMRWQESQRILN
jgi:hypothetical protein